jgi:hypothetical protein
VFLFIKRYLNQKNILRSSYEVLRIAPKIHVSNVVDLKYFLSISQLGKYFLKATETCAASKRQKLTVTLSSIYLLQKCLNRASIGGSKSGQKLHSAFVALIKILDLCHKPLLSVTQCF